jgi:salicylate hydroxylase
VSAHGDRPVLIAGGGIGGLGAAIALARRGIPAHVLEAEPAFSETGAGIQIGPNGARILRALGLGDALDAGAARPEAVAIRDGLSGRVLARVPLGRAAEIRHGAPYYVAERRVLHSLLLDQAQKTAGIEIATGFRLTAFRQRGDGVVAVAAGGREAAGRALIGADGVHSRTRAILFGAAPSYSGRNAWRATSRWQDLAGDFRDSVQLWLGPDAHLVVYALGADAPLNAVAVTAGPAASPGWGASGEAAALHGHFSRWCGEARRLLEGFKDWMIWPLLALAPLKRWSDGAVTLLGDAAHPLMPFLASGAVMAIEDAAVLAAQMEAAGGDAGRAFKAYEDERMPRTGRVQTASARMGEVYHMSGLMRAARNLTLTAAPGSLLLARNDWIYGYRAPGT